MGFEDLVGAGEGFLLKCESESMVRGRAERVSAAISVSGRGVGGAGVGRGEDGLLVGLRKAGVLSACIMKEWVRREVGTERTDGVGWSVFSKIV